MIDYLVYLIAPRRPADFVLRAIGVLGIVNLINWGVNAWFKGSTDLAPVEYLIATAVGLPFVVLALMLLQRQRRLQEQLANMAVTDMLTGLYNRRGFEAAAEERPPAALILADIDHFKAINDSFGHAAGDAGLRQVADRIRATLREDETAGRLGGEEFGIMLTRPDKARVAAIAERMVNPFLIELNDTNAGPQMTLSCGAVFATEGQEGLHQMLASADRALYRAKSQGRARLVIDGADAGDKGGPIAIAL
ncbi:GGDEF domain-containing protein [Pseudoroseicyclus sp. H15]